MCRNFQDVREILEEDLNMHFKKSIIKEQYAYFAGHDLKMKHSTIHYLAFKKFINRIFMKLK